MSESSARKRWLKLVAAASFVTLTAFGSVNAQGTFTDPLGETGPTFTSLRPGHHRSRQR